MVRIAHLTQTSRDFRIGPKTDFEGTRKRSCWYDVWEFIVPLVLGHGRLQPRSNSRTGDEGRITSGALSASVRPLLCAW